MITSTMLERAQGCLLGQLCGDSLGSLVEFKRASVIAEMHPNGVCNMEDGGPFQLLAGQPTDDSEMALALARSLVKENKFSLVSIDRAYQRWVKSKPFDIGTTTLKGLGGKDTILSESNGALMRVSPLGLFGVLKNKSHLYQWAMWEAELSHINPVCSHTSAIFAVTLAVTIEANLAPLSVYEFMLQTARNMGAPASVIKAIKNGKTKKPKEYHKNMGWVLIALQNAVYQLCNAEGFVAGVQDTINQGGDTDTNAAICGALLGAVYGVDAIPNTWTNTVLNCTPTKENLACFRPRPKEYWPTDALQLAEQLMKAGH